jgi:hypothetical protein
VLPAVIVASEYCKGPEAETGDDVSLVYGPPAIALRYTRYPTTLGSETADQLTRTAVAPAAEAVVTPDGLGSGAAVIENVPRDEFTFPEPSAAQTVKA